VEWNGLIFENTGAIAGIPLLDIANPGLITVSTEQETPQVFTFTSLPDGYIPINNYINGYSQIITDQSNLLVADGYNVVIPVWTAGYTRKYVNKTNHTFNIIGPTVISSGTITTGVYEWNLNTVRSYDGYYYQCNFSGIGFPVFMTAYPTNTNYLSTFVDTYANFQCMGPATTPTLAPNTSIVLYSNGVNLIQV
jgi:hypothetical protein